MYMASDWILFVSVFWRDNDLPSVIFTYIYVYLLSTVEIAISLSKESSPNFIIIREMAIVFVYFNKTRKTSVNYS